MFKRLLSKIAGFRGAAGGNVAITFALATLPIVGMVGFAVDYSHANSVKAAMQAALDSTALMVSKNASTVSSSALQTEAATYFAALFTRREAKNITINATYTTTGGSTVTVTGSGNVPTAFLGVIGYNNIAVNGSATAKWGSARLRVALVLDNTGSMADSGKITALKTATTSLLTQLKLAATTNGDVYVSIIPFVKDVNVGASNYNASWIDWTDWNAANGTTSSVTTTSFCFNGTLRGRL
jgi:Flp pilus assembly protein TadG